MRWVREFIAIAFWTTATVQAFLWNVVGWAVDQFPWLDAAIRYRLLVGLGTCAVCWLFGTRFLLSSVGYVAAYPAILLFWRLPAIGLRNWPVLLAFSPAIHSVVVNLKATVVLFTAAVISAALVLFGEYQSLIVAAMGFLAVYLLLHFTKRFKSAFAQSTVFAVYGNAIRDMWQSVNTSDAFRMPQGLRSDDPEYEQKLAGPMLVGYTAVTVLAVLGERLQQVSQSRWLDWHALASLIHTILVVTVLFALELNGLERVMPGSFVGVHEPNFIAFLGLSFSALTNSNISPIKPATDMAQLMLHLEVMCAIAIFAVGVAFWMLTTRRERYREDLDAVVKEMQTAEVEIARLTEQNFSLTVAAVEQLLVRRAGVVVKWLIKQRYGAQRASEILAKADVPSNPSVVTARLAESAPSARRATTRRKRKK